MVACNVAIPQLLWFTAVRRNLIVLFAIVILVNVGMWFERFVIIVASLQRDYLPSAWSDYTPTSIEVATFVGTLRAVLHAVPAVLPLRAGDRDLGDQGDRGRGGAAVSGGLTGARFGGETELLAAVRAARAGGFAIPTSSPPTPCTGSTRRWRRGARACRGSPWRAVSPGWRRRRIPGWAAVVDWPLDVGGKPANSAPAFLPISFELTILLGGARHRRRLLLAQRARPPRRPPAAGAGHHRRRPGAGARRGRGARRPRCASCWKPRELATSQGGIETSP